MSTAVLSKNAWRAETPGNEGWTHSPRPGARDKYFIVSTDNHAQEPNDLWNRVDERFRERVPHIKLDDDGAQWLITEGWSPQLVKPGRSADKYIFEREKFENFDVLQVYTSRMEAEDIERAQAGSSDIGRRLADMERDGIDAEIIYPQKGILAFATKDAAFSSAMCSAWNRWALEAFGPHFGKMNPAALVATGDIKGAISEVQWAAANGFKSLFFSNKPVFGPSVEGELQYNDKQFEPLWSAVAETGLPINFHVSTGKDPRAVKGNGGAIINYVCHALSTTIEPLVQMISSGVFERHPRIMAGSVEAGFGWVPWLLDAMDHGYRAHHMWVRPVIPELPSHYFRKHCFATFMIDATGIANLERANIVDNAMWASDYPHHEGTWPHSAAAIERQMGSLDESARAKILGLNAARIYKLDLPPQQGLPAYTG